MWGALTRAGPHQAQNGWVEPHVVMLYSAATHLRPVNLVGTQPFFGAQGFQEKVCNKARAYLDCQTEHPCPSVPRLICLLLHHGLRYRPVVLPPLSVSCSPWMVRSILGCWLAWGAGEPGEPDNTLEQLLLMPTPSRRSFGLVYSSFSSRLILIFTLLTLSRRSCVCVSLSLIVFIHFTAAEP